MNVNNQIFIPITACVYEMFFDSDSEADDEDSGCNDYFYKKIERMDTHQFKRHFRLNASTFEDVMNKLHSVYSVPKIGHPEIALEKSTLICIWYLSNMESLRGVAARFEVSKSTAWSALLRVCKALHLVSQRFGIITWPSPRRCTATSNYFFEKHRIPGVVGSIDGCHIRIVAPKQHAASYINRKGYHSVILQGVCDEKKLFTDVYIGEVGSVHDYTVFLKSEVSRRPQNHFPNDSHLIGDLAYKLSTKMLVGFKNNGFLNNRQKNFNKALSKARVVIENTFALLKGRFRRLKYVESQTPEHVCAIILSACILHNVCILKGDHADEMIDNVQFIADQPENELDVNRNEHDQQAIIKRANIVNTFI